MYQEPCCITHKLPPLMESQRYTLFQTNGDVTITKMIEAVSWMALGTPRVFFLATTEVDVYLLRLVRYYFRREWISGFILLTQGHFLEMVREELADVLPFVCYGCHPDIGEGAMAFLGDSRHVYVQGPTLLQPCKQLCLYTAYCGPSQTAMRSGLEAFFPKVRLYQQIEPTDAHLIEVLNYHF